jgi:hypothetical protein
LAGGAVGVGLAVAWWFRHNDRKVRDRLRRARPTPAAAPPAADGPPFGPRPSDN